MIDTSCHYQIHSGGSTYCRIYRGDTATQYLAPMQVTDVICRDCKLRNLNLDFRKLYLHSQQTPGVPPQDVENYILEPKVLPTDHTSPAVATADHTSPEPEMPRDKTLPQKAVKYAVAVTRWKLAGSPTRSDAEVARIYAICNAPCKFFRQGSQVCRLCGCRLAGGGSGWKNKIRMATERCAKGYW